MRHDLHTCAGAAAPALASLDLLVADVAGAGEGWGLHAMGGVDVTLINKAERQHVRQMLRVQEKAGACMRWEGLMGCRSAKKKCST